MVTGKKLSQGKKTQGKNGHWEKKIPGKKGTGKFVSKPKNLQKKIRKITSIYIINTQLNYCATQNVAIFIYIMCLFNDPNQISTNHRKIYIIL